jgi:hypothetical protein
MDTVEKPEDRGRAQHESQKNGDLTNDFVDHLSLPSVLFAWKIILGWADGQWRKKCNQGGGFYYYYVLFYLNDSAYTRRGCHGMSHWQPS